MPFHNVTHTEEVVKCVSKIGKALDIEKTDLEPVLIAAWFHDTGFCKVYNGHEEVSIRLAKAFLEKQGYATEQIQLVMECIRATKMPQNPETKLAQVLCDADLFHVSTPDFFYRKQLLRKEWEMKLEKFYTDIEWHKLNYDFLKDHHFFTAHGKKKLEMGQNQNVEKVMNLIDLCRNT